MEYNFHCFFSSKKICIHEGIYRTRITNLFFIIIKNIAFLDSKKKKKKKKKGIFGCKKKKKKKKKDLWVSTYFQHFNLKLLHFSIRNESFNFFSNLYLFSKAFCSFFFFLICFQDEFDPSLWSTLRVPSHPSTFSYFI